VVVAEIEHVAEAAKDIVVDHRDSGRALAARVATWLDMLGTALGWSAILHRPLPPCGIGAISA